MHSRPDFTLFLAGTTISSIGSAAAPVALSFALFGRGAGPGQVGAVMAAEALPIVLLTLVGGVLADRFSPRPVMIAADLLRAGAQALLAFHLLRGPVAFGWVLGLTALVGFGTGLAAPGRNRLLTQIVPSARLASANGRLMIATSTAGLLGPALGGALVAGVGAAWAIGLDAATYVASATLLACLRPDAGPPQSAGRPGMIRQLREGWDEFARRSWVWTMVCLFSLLHLLSWAPLQILGASIYAHRPEGAIDWGTLEALAGGGAIVGGALATRLRPARPIRAVLLWLLLYPPLPISLAASLPFWVQAACFACSGIGTANVNVIWESTLQRVIPADRLSRVSAYDTIGSVGLLPLGYMLAGPMALLFGTTASLAFGAAAVLAMILALLARPETRDAATA